MQDFVIADYNQQSGIVVDVAIPADINIATKEQYKEIEILQVCCYSCCYQNTQVYYHIETISYLETK